MKIIVISGKAGAGKDTLGEIIRDKLEALDKTVLITHYADLVKYMCKQFFGWDGVKDEYGRGLMQYVGTDVVRKQNPDYWVDFLIGVFSMFDREWDYAIIPDCRFPNEIDRLRKHGFEVTHIRIVRPGFENILTDEQRSHSSETAMDDIEPDYTVMNVGCVDMLRESVVVTVGE